MAWCMRRWTCDACRLFIVSRCVRIPCAAATSTASSVPVRAAPTCFATRWCRFASSGACPPPPAHAPRRQPHQDGAVGRGRGGGRPPGRLQRWARRRCGGSWSRRTTPRAASWPAARRPPRAASAARAPPAPPRRRPPPPSGGTPVDPSAPALRSARTRGSIDTASVFNVSKCR